MEKSELTEKTKLISDGIFLACLTATSYLAAYVFERGYADYFGIPFETINVTIERMIAAGLSVLMFSFFIFWILNIFVIFGRDLLKMQDSPIKRVVLIHILAIIAAIVSYSAFGTFKWVLIIFGCVVVLLDFPIFMAGLFRKLSDKNKMSFKERFEDVITNEPGTDMFDIIIQKFGKRPLIAILGILLIIGISYAAGNRTARNKSSFWVNESENLVLLQKYGNIFIFKTYDPEEKMIELKNSVRLLDIDQISKHNLVQKKIGRLKDNNGDS